MSKFVQIAPNPDINSDHYMFALDDEGKVWALERGQWIRMVDARYDPPNTKPIKEGDK